MEQETTHLVLFAGEVADLQAPVYARLPVVGRCGLQETEPAADELFRVFTRRSEIDKFDLFGRGDEQGYIWCREGMGSTLRMFLFHRKFVQLGSVCIALNTNSSFRQRSIILVAIFIDAPIKIMSPHLYQKGLYLITVLL